MEAHLFSDYENTSISRAGFDNAGMNLFIPYYDIMTSLPSPGQTGTRIRGAVTGRQHPAIRARARPVRAPRGHFERAGNCARMPLAFIINVSTNTRRFEERCNLTRTRVGRPGSERFRGNPKNGAHFHCHLWR